MRRSMRAVNVRLKRCHCATSGGWWRQLQHISRNVFHMGGEGKKREHARAHSSKSTLSMRSHNWSPRPSVDRGQTRLHTVDRTRWHLLPVTWRQLPKIVIMFIWFQDITLVLSRNAEGHQPLCEEEVDLLHL